MKFVSPFVAIVGSLAFTNAATMAPQDMISMQQTFDKLFIGIDKTLVDVRSFNGDPSGVAKIVSDISELQKITVDGADRMRKSAAMGIPDVLTILGPVGVMENMFGEVINALSKKKVDFIKVGANKQILDAVTNLKTAAEGLGKAVVAGLPLSAITGIIGTPIANLVTAPLDAGVKEWSATLSATDTTA
jgi:hypothetical protein